MSEQSTQWSQSQKDAFGFVQRSVSDGLSARAGLKQYRAGGGHIGNEYWFSLYKTSFNIEGWKDTIKQVPMTYNVTDVMFTHTDLDWREQYVMQMNVRGWSEELGQNVTKWVTAESATILTKREWMWGAQQAVDAGLGSPVFAVDTVLEWSAMKRDPWRDEI